MRTSYTLGYDKTKNDHGSEPRLDPTTDSSDDLKDVINDNSDYDRSKAENTDETPIVLDSSSHEDVDRDSNPREKAHHAHIEKSGPERDEDIHPDGRNTAKTKCALGHDKRENDHDSEPRMVQTVNIIDDLTEVINETPEYVKSEDEAESDSEEDNKETNNVPVVILNTIVAGNIDEKPTVSKSISQEEPTKNSNLRAESHHTRIGKTGPELEEDETRKNADTDMRAYSNNHPDDKHTVKTDYAIKCDIMEDDHGSGPRLIQAVDITDCLVPILS